MIEKLIEANQLIKHSARHKLLLQKYIEALDNRNWGYSSKLSDKLRQLELSAPKQQ